MIHILTIYVLSSLLVLTMLTYIVLCIKNKIPIFSKHNNIFLGEEEVASMNKDKGLMKGLMFIIVLLTIALVFSVLHETNQGVLSVTQTQTIVLADTPAVDKININDCTREEFKALEGVGDSKADKFIAVRDALGGYQNIYDLTEYDVLGEKVFDDIKNSLTVGGEG